MLSDAATFISNYGYAAIFLFVLLQELGVPNPVTNEFVLLFGGYLAYSGVLNLWGVLAMAIAADCIGTTILYALFYRFGAYLLKHQPRWLPIQPERINEVSQRLAGRNQWRICVGRMVPFVRGYVSVGAGILRVPPAAFLPAVIVPAILWSGGYVVAGWLLGPYWERVAAMIGRRGKQGPARGRDCGGDTDWAGGCCTKSAPIALCVRGRKAGLCVPDNCVASCIWSNARERN